MHGSRADWAADTMRHNSQLGPADPRSKPGGLLVTRSIPRLLGAATVGVGVAAVGYVGLVTGACPLDLGVGRRVRPLGPQLVEMAAPREVVFDVIAELYLVGRHERWPTSCGCWSAAATWCWRPISPRWVGGWVWLPRRWRRSGSAGPSGSTSGWSAGRCPMSWRRSTSASRPVGPARGWPIRGDRGRPVAGRGALVRAGRCPLGADGGSLAGGGQG